MIFNPIVVREKACTEEMLQYIIDSKYESERPMGNVACSDMGRVISISLVGLSEKVVSVVPRALQWIEAAIERGERFGVDKNGYQTTLHWGRSIGEWLLDGANNNYEWRTTSVYQEARWSYEKSPWTAREILKSGLNDYMAFAYQGGEYDEGFEAGIEMYERWTGKSGPVSISKVLKPYEFAYALCLHRTARYEFDEDDLFHAGRRMLQANLESEWLGGGQMIRAATWLKIVYWFHDGTLTPLQTLLKAYENMPNVQKPSFVLDI